MADRDGGGERFEIIVEMSYGHARLTACREARIVEVDVNFVERPAADEGRLAAVEGAIAELRLVRRSELRFLKNALTAVLEEWLDGRPPLKRAALAALMSLSGGGGGGGRAFGTVSIRGEGRPFEAIAVTCGEKTVLTTVPGARVAVVDHDRFLAETGPPWPAPFEACLRMSVEALKGIESESLRGHRDASVRLLEEALAPDIGGSFHKLV